MLSKKTKYGLKALAFLARQEKNKTVWIAVVFKSEIFLYIFLKKTPLCKTYRIVLTKNTSFKIIVYKSQTLINKIRFLKFDLYKTI